MHYGVPTIFVPQEKWADDQLGRARRAARAGAALILESALDAVSLKQAVERWRDPALRRTVSEAAQRLVPRSHSAEAAQQLLALVSPGFEETSAPL
jgi:UDP-N-acetylglucosamine:LPS N-acetylglucosamine transferase